MKNIMFMKAREFRVKKNPGLCRHCNKLKAQGPAGLCGTCYHLWQDKLNSCK